MKEKVEVGQILTNSQYNERWQIVEIGPHLGASYAFARKFRKDGSMSDKVPFGPLTADGLHGGWGAGWEIETPAPQAPALTQSSNQVADKELQFFRASAHPENCGKCGSPRPCTYHP
jgi:hypothetical protein